uniref:Uncharacterized protein n=1 Tax=Anguilla anguilla TaxID=7936 RepID=A0A0E9SPM8_ANGAN
MMVMRFTFGNISKQKGERRSPAETTGDGAAAASWTSGKNEDARKPCTSSV